ncbi:MAG TPA: glycosyltransferase [Solirubrobacteraceae bacterium]|nr:glycosyltransferase [Solirubrobacteraceae bacterium]
MQVLTLATPDTLPQARVLARSLAVHQPDWRLDVLLMGGGRVLDAARASGEPFAARSAATELDVDMERLIARHDEHELSVLLLPRLLRLHAQRGSGPVLHLPPTAWVVGSLAPIEAALAVHSVLLVPRMLADVPEDDLEPKPREMRRLGRIDDTLMGTNGTPGAEGFLAWWGTHVEHAIGPIDGGRRGSRPEDRPWLARLLELAPARFSTGVLEDAGSNLSMWNLHDSKLESTPSGLVVDGGRPALFFNLPGFEPDHPHRLARHASRVRVSSSPVLRDICVRYAAELHEAGWQDAGQRLEIGRRLADGLVYDERMHALYARARWLGEQFGDLFSAEGTRAFTQWLQGPAPEGGAHGINRYVFYRVAQERPDVLRAYPDLDGGDGAGYVAWCWAFGREELAIPEPFLPPPPGTSPRVSTGVVVPPVAGGAPAPEAPQHGLDETAAKPAANGSPAVRVTGYLGHTLGLGSAARGYVRALAAAGVPVSTVSVPLHHLVRPEELAAEYGAHRFEELIHEGRHGFDLVAVNADELPGFVERLGEDYFEGPRIGIWGWETNSIPLRWRRAFALIDEIWVYSQFMAENIGAVAPVPVIPLPPPVLAPAEPANPLRLGVPEGFLFLFVFDYLSTVERKNPVGLIEAFTQAFAPGEGAQLLIKTINAPLRPLPEEEVLWAAHGRPDIHLIDRSLSGQELEGLMAGCDCYVSLHRAEGFGLTMAEAMAIGKPVIATGYSGNVDFMNGENSYLVEHALSLVGPESEIYPAEGEWAQPSVEHAARLMRRVYENPQEAANVGARAREDIARRLSPAATGAAMRRRLERIG